MCGRFVGFRKFEELNQYFPIDEADCKVTASYNIAPSEEILAIYRQDNKNRLDRFHWGLVPFWAKDASIGNRMINARAETIAHKPSFKHPFKKRRCLIPADGFYEWTGKKGQKQPVYLTIKEKHPFAFAGIWDTWNKDKKDGSGSPYRSCAIITTPASESVCKIHHRMPAILRPEMYASWLDENNQDIIQLTDILQKGLITELVGHPVSTQVNSARVNDPGNIQPMKQMTFGDLEDL